MPGWSIYYASGAVVSGKSKRAWKAAPDTGVQVVVVRDPPPTPRPDRYATGYVECSALKPDVPSYTGVDIYDPLDYGAPKKGALMDRAAYDAIWGRASGDS